MRTPDRRHDVGLAQTAACSDVVDRLGDIQEILATELPLRILRRVPIGLDAEPPTRDVGIGAEECRDFVVRPDVERSLGLVSACWSIRRQAVGVFGGIEAAQRIREVAQDVVQRVFGDGREEVLAGGLSCLEIRHGELCLVVEHLLEVRYTPLRVYRVPMESSADVIAQASHCHRAQRVRGHEERRLRRDTTRDAPRVLPQQEQHLGRPGKLRRVSKPSVAPIERHLKLLDPGVERVDSGHCRTRARLTISARD